VATAEQALQWVNRLYRVLSRRRPLIEKRYRYFEGEHSLTYATDEWSRFHKDRYRGFSDNWCGVVAQSPVDRLRIDGFRLGDSTDVVSADEKQLWSDWQRNEMAAQSNQGFLASTVASRSATLVWGDENDDPQVSWERPDQMIVDYDAGHRARRAALKVWCEDGYEYATLYLPDEVWKFERQSVRATLEGYGFKLPRTVESAGGGWSRREVPGEQWPLSNPLGVVPVVEWLNKPHLGGHPISDIDGVMAMQDAINLMWGYLFSAADYASMPARVVTGAEPPKVPILNDSGEVVGTKPATMEDLTNKRLLFLPGVDGKANIAQWDAAKLDVFTSVVVEAIGHVAAQTRTPGHYMLTNEKFANLNGDALTAAEVPLVGKVENSHIHYNPAAKETAALMALVRGKKDVAQAIRESDGRQFVQWRDAGMYSLAQVADAATKDRAVGMSLRTVLERRYGFTEEEIDQEMRRVAAEQADPFLQQALTQSVTSGNETGAAPSGV
jgi:hypothetical protein